MENMQLLNAAAFAQDQELLKDMIDMRDKLNHPIGVILISNVSQCPECGGNLIVRKDRYSKVTLYSKSMGTVFARHYYKYCKNNRHGCNVSQHYGYYTVGDAHRNIYDDNWAELPYFISSHETAFETSMLKTFDAELLIGQMSYKQKADIYNYDNGYEMISKQSAACNKEASTTKVIR